MHQYLFSTIILPHLPTPRDSRENDAQLSTADQRMSEANLVSLIEGLTRVRLGAPSVSPEPALESHGILQ